MALEELVFVALGIAVLWYLTKGAGGSTEENVKGEKKPDYYRTPSL